MTLRFELHPLAEDEIADAWLWYESLGAGLGDRFIAAVRAAIEQATKWPDSGQTVTEGEHDSTRERRIPTRDFPWAIRYRALDDMVLVTVVYHQHRHPDYGHGR